MKTITLILAAMLFATSNNKNLFAQNETSSPAEIHIGQNWKFSEAGEENWLPATVPGTVHTDLMANGIIEDPHYRKNENDVQWIEVRDWEYKTTFQADRNIIESYVVELYFKGLDTYAEVYLNEQLILESNNMFVGWTVDVKDAIVEGDNDLRILFHSPVKKGMEKLRQVDYYIPAVNEQAPIDKRTSVFTRKAPFHYGWDWGPRLVTSGIWRPVVLKAWNHAKIDDLYVRTRYINEDRANIAGRAEIKVKKPDTYTFSLHINGEDSGMTETIEMDAGKNVIVFDVNIQDPKLLWTNGLGDPYLYDFTFELTGEQTGQVDTHQLDFGVRTLRLVQEPDEIGRSFYFELNGVPVFMKGANVIPSETLTPAVTEETYHRLFDNTIAANMNMLRVWGGAIYEEDIFYVLADKHGILIWQDFMFACNLNPGDEAHLENVRLEAEYNVKRLRNHASIALWTGNNENLHGWHEWGWKEMYEPEVREFMWRTYERKFHEILPEVVNRLDPGTPYWPSSPSSYGNMEADRLSGDEHDWTIWFGQEPFSSYGENVPRFISEYGMQAFPGMHTIREFSVEEDWEWDSPVMRHRQRGGMEYIEPEFDGNDMIRRYMGRYYDVPEKFEHFVYVSQIMHAKAYKTAIEAHRRNMPNTMGSLYWQINDSWPTISWATVDYYGRWKAAHYSVRKAYEEIILSPFEEDEKFRVFAVSDRLENLESAGLEIRLMDFQGTILYTVSRVVTVEGNTSSIIFEEDLDSLLEDAGFEKNSLVVSVELLEGGFPIADNLYFFNRPVDLDLPEAEIIVTAEETEGGYLLSVTSNVLVKNLFLDTRFGDLFFEDNYFDLLPDVTRIIKVKTDRDLDLEEEIRLLSLNKLKNS